MMSKPAIGAKYGLDYPRFNPQAPDQTSTALLLESIATAGETELLSVARAIYVICPQMTYCNVGSLLKDRQSTKSLARFSFPNQNPIKQKASLFSSLGNTFFITATVLLAGLVFWRLRAPLAIAHRWIPVAFPLKKDVE